jgi:hypothetical protein
MRYQSSVGLDRDEIGESDWSGLSGSRGRSSAIARSGRPPALGLYRQVMLVLFYLRQKVSQTVLADLYGVSQPTVSRIYWTVMPPLDQVLCVHEPETPQRLPQS